MEHEIVLGKKEITLLCTMQTKNPRSHVFCYDPPSGFVLASDSRNILTYLPTAIDTEMSPISMDKLQYGSLVALKELGKKVTAKDKTSLHLIGGNRMCVQTPVPDVVDSSTCGSFMETVELGTELDTHYVRMSTENFRDNLLPVMRATGSDSRVCVLPAQYLKTLGTMHGVASLSSSMHVRVSENVLIVSVPTDHGTWGLISCADTCCEAGLHPELSELE